MTITIEIDNKKITTEQGATVMEAADNAGLDIRIPRFCYHKKLSIAANCRMCMVEVEKAPKPLPACATPVSDGMKVWTKSPIARDAQSAVMEFLLINHPLDCPICDQAGECELQDNSLGFGSARSKYSEEKRVVVDKSLGPLIATDLTRCIHCTRCVRFGTEIAGMRELGATGRGEHTKITTFVTKNVDSVVSGNVIDLCPVGALTSKPYRYSTRSWELHKRKSIAAHDSLGSNIIFHVKNNQVFRAVPDHNEEINEMWLSDRDRFSYQAIHSTDRLNAPIQKQPDGSWQEITWQQAISAVQSQLENVKPELLGALCSPNVTLEEQFLLQTWLRDLGCNNIDSRLQQTDFRNQHSTPIYPSLNIEIKELENLDNIILIGAYIKEEMPLLTTRLHKMQQNGGKITAVDFLDLENLQAAIVAAVQSKSNNLILLGNMAVQHPEYAVILQIVEQAAGVSNAKIGHIHYGANNAGAWFAGCVPHRLAAGSVAKNCGLNISEMISQKLPAYFLYGIEPSLDCAQGLELMQALRQAGCVIACSAYKTEDLTEVADLILPITTSAETSGTFINTNGVWQSFNAAIESVAQSKQGWDLLNILANSSYQSSSDILKVIKSLATNNPSKAADVLDLPNKNSDDVIRLAPVALYGSDYQVRRAIALQKTNHAKNSYKLRVNSRANLKESSRVVVTNAATNNKVILEVIIDDAIPDNAVIIASGISTTLNLGAPYARINIATVDLD